MGFYISKVQNKVLSLVISDYFRKTTNELWIENSEMTGLKDCRSCHENVSLSLAKRKQVEKKSIKVFYSIR